MLSHTVPKKLLEHFAYDDPITGSRRLWRYEQGLAPYGRAAPKTATRWEGQFAHPDNATKEAEVETRLKREFEDPVNQFIDDLRYQTFPFTPTQVRLLTAYLTMLFHRSRARRAASTGQQEALINAFRALRDDDELLAQLVGKMTMDLIPAGLRRMATKEEAIMAIDNRIAEESKGDSAQRGYLHTMETMMEFSDNAVRDGAWRILTAPPDHPFVVGDAPVVTWERTDEHTLVFGQGFGRPNVEACLPVFPTACLHVLPAVARTQRVLTPSTEEVNRAQAAFATQHCFTNMCSNEIDTALQPHFGTARLGIDGFRIDHIDLKQKLFDILMNQPPYAGTIIDRDQ